MRFNKFTKLASILLGTAASVACLSVAVACNNTPEPAHEHTWATEYTKTEYEHYYAATCEGHETEKKDVGGHRFADGACTVCGYPDPNVVEAKATFAYEEVEGGIEIYAYTGDAMDEITVPATIDGKKVVSIADDTFTILNEEPDARLDSLKQIKTIKFEAEIKTIGKRNFSRMASLKEITIPDSVTSIDAGCFTNNSQLTKVIITSGDVDLSSDAFSYNPKLATIQLPIGIRSASSSSFRSTSSELEITFEGSANLFRAVTINALTRLGNATIIPYGGENVVTETEGAYVYKLNEDGNSYSIIALTEDIVSETVTEIYLPLTYKEKPITAIDDAVFNSNAYENKEISDYLKKTVTVIDVNSQVTAHDTNIKYIGRYNFVGLEKTDRITLPLELEQDTLIGCLNNFRLAQFFRIPKGIKVMKDCFSWDGAWFYSTQGAFTWMCFPESFERFEGYCWGYDTSLGGAGIVSFFCLQSCADADAVEKMNSILDNSTIPTTTWAGATLPFFKGWAAAGLFVGEGNVHGFSYDLFAALGF